MLFASISTFQIRLMTKCDYHVLETVGTVQEKQHVDFVPRIACDKKMDYGNQRHSFLMLNTDEKTTILMHYARVLFLNQNDFLLMLFAWNNHYYDDPTTDSSLKVASFFVAKSYVTDLLGIFSIVYSHHRFQAKKWNKRREA